MKTNRWLYLAAALLVFAAGASAQEFWEKKPYTEWNKDQCKKLLEGSPWVSHSGAVDVQQAAFTSGPSTEGTITSGASQGSERKIDYYARIMSALPVRQATIRKAMIDNKYEKLSPEQKKLFDDSAAQFLAREYADVIVVVVEFSSNQDDIIRELARYWQGFPSGTFPQNTYLVGNNGVRVAPVRFAADTGAGRSFQLAFPRVVDGQPLVTPETKAIRLEIPAPTFAASSQGTAAGVGRDPATGGREANVGSRGLNEARLFFEFKPEKMKYKGELMF